jgi:DNA polymerase III delta subunit
MLYIFYGSDTGTSGKKALALVESLREKRPDASYVRMSGEDWSLESVKEHTEGQGLFVNKYIVYLDRVTENSSAKEDLASVLPAMKVSPNIFVLREGAVGVALVKDFAKNADKEVVSEAPKKGFDWAGDHSFAFVDAFMGRKGLDVWKNYRAAVGKGLEAEAILGSLFWQVKSAIVASRSKSASESGLAPFVYTKSKKITEMWSGAELAEVTTARPV